MKKEVRNILSLSASFTLIPAISLALSGMFHPGHWFERRYRYFAAILLFLLKA